MTLAEVPMEAAQATLEELAASINREHELCIAAALSSLEHAVRCGEALLKAREAVPRGTWERWLDENCPHVFRQARPYMRLASYREFIPVGHTNMTDALKELRGLPAFDGTGPAKHPPEIRDEALRLLGEGIGYRMVASMLDIDHKAVQRWGAQEKGEQPREKSREGNFRTGRPGQRELKRRQQLRESYKRAIGPAALASTFKAVFEAHRAKERRALIASLQELATSAEGWAAQLGARDG